MSTQVMAASKSGVRQSPTRPGRRPRRLAGPRTRKPARVLGSQVLGALGTPASVEPELHRVRIPAQPGSTDGAAQQAQIRWIQAQRGASPRPVSVPPIATPGPRPVVGVRLTGRGRTVVLVAFLAGLLALMVGFGGWAVATWHAPQPLQVRLVQVRPGDTLYGIAERYGAGGDVRSEVYQIEQLNSLPGAALRAGQTIAVPR